MADKDLIRRGNTSIQVYRSLDAAPEDWDAARFWLINELRRIQTGFFSVDEVLARLDAGKDDGPTDGTTSTTPGPVGPQGPAGPAGPEGPQGPAGADGNAGDLIADYQTALHTTWSSQKIASEIASTSVGGIGEAPQDGTPYSRQDASWIPAAIEPDYWLSGGIAISNSLDLMEGGNASSTPAEITFNSGLLTIG